MKNKIEMFVENSIPFEQLTIKLAKQDDYIELIALYHQSNDKFKVSYGKHSLNSNIIIDNIYMEDLITIDEILENIESLIKTCWESE